MQKLSANAHDKPRRGWVWGSTSSCGGHCEHTAQKPLRPQEEARSSRLHSWSVSERPLVAQHHWRSCQQASAHAGSAHSASGGPAWGAPWEGGPSEHQQDCRVGIPFWMGAQGKLPWHLLISQTLLGRLLQHLLACLSLQEKLFGHLLD